MTDTINTFVAALREGDEAAAAIAAIDLTANLNEENTVPWDETDYNDTELANLIQARVTVMHNAGVNENYGTHIPTIQGLALAWLERKVLGNDEVDDGDTGSESIEQG